MPRDSLSLPSLFFLCACIATYLQASMREKFENYVSPASILGSFESPEYNQLRARGMSRDMVDMEVISLKSPEAGFTSGRGSGKYKALCLAASGADSVPSFLQKRKRNFSTFGITNYDEEEETKDTPVSVAVDDVKEDGTYEDFPAAAVDSFNPLDQERIKRNRIGDAESSASSFEDSDDDEIAAGSQELGAMKADNGDFDAEESTEMLTKTFWKETARFWDAAAVYRSSTSSTPTSNVATCKRKLSPAMSSGGSAFNGIRISPDGNMMTLSSPFVRTGLSPDGDRMGISPANPLGQSPAAIDGGVSFPPKISESRVNPSAFRLAVPVPVMGSSNLLNSRLSTSGSPVRRSSPHINLASLSPQSQLGALPRSPNGILNPIKDEQEDDYESELDFELDFEGFVLCDIDDEGRIKGGRPI